jgi:hypothetical protein
MKCFAFVLLCFCLSCTSKSALYVEKQLLDSSHFAHNFAASPPFYQKGCEPDARYIIYYKLPKVMKATVHFIILTSDLKQHTLTQSIQSQKGYASFEINRKELDVLSFRVQIITSEGETLSEYKHPHWVRVINFDKES